MNRSLFASIAVSFASVLGASQAHALDLNYSGFANSAEVVLASVAGSAGPVSEYAYAGGFAASNNGGPSFTTYCVDLYDDLPFNQTISFTPVDGSAHAFDNVNANVDLGKLFAEGNVVNNATSQAAFQLAIWEITYETSGHYSLADGNAQFAPGDQGNSTDAIALASSWLAELPNVKGGSKITVLESVGANGTRYQDQVMAMAVPEPSTYALMAAGLLSIGFMARRRSNSQR